MKRRKVYYAAKAFILMTAFLCCCSDEMTRKQALEAFQIGLDILGTSEMAPPKDFESLVVNLQGRQAITYTRNDINTLRLKLRSHLIDSTHPTVRNYDGKNVLIGEINVKMKKATYTINVRRCTNFEGLYILEYYSLDSPGSSRQFILMHGFEECFKKPC